MPAPSKPLLYSGIAKAALAFDAFVIALSVTFLILSSVRYAGKDLGFLNPILEGRPGKALGAVTGIVMGLTLVLSGGQVAFRFLDCCWINSENAKQTNSQ